MHNNLITFAFIIMIITVVNSNLAKDNSIVQCGVWLSNQCPINPPQKSNHTQLICSKTLPTYKGSQKWEVQVCAYKNNDQTTPSEHFQVRVVLDGNITKITPAIQQNCPSSTGLNERVFTGKCQHVKPATIGQWIVQYQMSANQFIES